MNRLLFLLCLFCMGCGDSVLTQLNEHAEERFPDVEKVIQKIFGDTPVTYEVSLTKDDSSVTHPYDGKIDYLFTGNYQSLVPANPILMGPLRCSISFKYSNAKGWTGPDSVNLYAGRNQVFPRRGPSEGLSPKIANMVYLPKNEETRKNREMQQVNYYKQRASTVLSLFNATLRAFTDVDKSLAENMEMLLGMESLRFNAECLTRADDEFGPQIARLDQTHASQELIDIVVDEWFDNNASAWVSDYLEERKE